MGIFDKRTGKPLGFIPTGWYPTKVITGKEWLAVLSAKGIRPTRPNVRGEYVLTLLKGTLGVIPQDQIEANLPAWTRQVEEGAPLYGFQKGNLPPSGTFFSSSGRTARMTRCWATWAGEMAIRI